MSGEDLHEANRPVYYEPMITSDQARELLKSDPTKISMRTFATGATRDIEEGKYDYEGFLSPVFLTGFGEYMHRHRVQKDGSLRDSDNWQKGMSFSVYMKSLWRHIMTLWRHHRGVPATDDEPIEDALMGVFFNIQGYYHELKTKR